jgi:hypothetical protein
MNRFFASTLIYAVALAEQQPSEEILLEELHTMAPVLNKSNHVGSESAVAL